MPRSPAAPRAGAEARALTRSATGVALVTAHILDRWRVDTKAHPDLYWLVLTAGLFVALTVLAAGWKLELSDAVFGRPSPTQEDGR